MEIQTYDPFYLFTTTGLKPEPIDMDTKVVVIADETIYQILPLTTRTRQRFSRSARILTRP